MKYVLFVADGLADLPVRRLANKTPLENMHSPNMSTLATISELGVVETVPKSMHVGTDTAFYTIMGYDVEKCYTGRAPLEAAGMGIELKEDEIALRCNLVSLSDDNFDESTMLSHSGFNVDKQKGKEIMEWLLAQDEFKAELEKLGVKVHVGEGFRHIAVVGNKDNFDIAKDFDVIPPYEIAEKAVKDYIKAESDNAKVVWDIMRKSNELLKNCPVNETLENKVNSIWLWGAGTKTVFTSVKERFGVNGAVISAVPLVKGIGTLCGMTPLAVEGATGDKHTNFVGKAEMTVKALKEMDYDFVLVHVEAPDECSHDGDLEGKLFCIEKLAEMIKIIMIGLDGEEFKVLFMTDHITGTQTRTHARGEVPFMMFDTRVDINRRIGFDEGTARYYGKKVEPAYTLIDKFFN